MVEFAVFIIVVMLAYISHQLGKIHGEISTMRKQIEHTLNRMWELGKL
jgi:hypothetical protein